MELTLSEKKEKISKNKIHQAIKKFEETQDKYSEFGAYDTEPRCAFYHAIRQHVAGSDSILMAIENPGYWELYSSMSGHKRAAKALATACKRVLKVIDAAPYKDLKQAHDWYGDILD